MGGRPRTPLDGYSAGAVAAKFLGAAFFGILVDVAILLAVGFCRGTQTLSAPTFWWILAGIPVVWGVLGIFFFQWMLNLGRDLFENLTGSGGRGRGF